MCGDSCGKWGQWRHLDFDLGCDTPAAIAPTRPLEGLRTSSCCVPLSQLLWGVQGFDMALFYPPLGTALHGFSMLSDSLAPCFSRLIESFILRQPSDLFGFLIRIGPLACSPQLDWTFLH